jgi:hypothetical protein
MYILVVFDGQFKLTNFAKVLTVPVTDQGSSVVLHMCLKETR